MRIEDLNIGEECLGKLRRAGVTRVEEIVEFLEASVGTGASTEIVWGGKCFDEVVDKLKLMGLWSEPEDFSHPGSFS